MRSQKLLPIIVLGVILTVLVAPAVYGFISISNVIMANATGGGVLGLNVNSSNLTTLDNFFINVSASSIINVSNVYSNPNDQGGLNITPNGTVLEWTNQSGIAVNISPVAAFGGHHVNGTPGDSATDNGNGNATWNLSVNFLDGLHTFKVYVWQNLTSGLSINISTLINVTVSRVGPNVTFANYFNNFNVSDNTSNIQLTSRSNVFSGTDLINASLYINGVFNGSIANTTNNTQTTVNLSALGETGLPYNLTFELRDPTGNSTNITLFNLTVDTTAPNVTFANYFNNFNVSDNTSNIQLTMRDNVFTQTNVLNASVYINAVFNGSIANTTNNTQVTVNLSALGETGLPYNLTFELADPAGNRQNITLFNLTVDTTAPNVSFANYLNNFNVSDNTSNIQLTMRDNVFTQTNVLNASVYINAVFNGSIANTTNNTQVTVNLSALGETGLPYNLTFELADPAGNRQNITLFNLTVDTTAPNATIDNRLNDTNTNDVTPEIEFTVRENIFNQTNVLNATLFVNDVRNQTLNATNNTQIAINLSTLASGMYNFTFELADPATNRQNITLSDVRIDTAGPTVTITVTPSDGISTGSYSTISCSRADESGGSGLNTTTLSLTVKDPAGTTKTITTGDIYTWNSAGNYLITCLQADIAGTTTTTTKTITVSASIDEAGPVATSSSTSVSGTFKDTAKLELPTSSKVVKEINFDIKNDQSVTNPSVTTKDYGSSQPTAVTNVTAGIALIFIELKANFNTSLLDKATFTVEVDKSKVKTKENVVAQRFVDGIWQDLKTIFKGEKSGKYSYEVETPGFSFFAIVEKPTGPATSPTTSPSASPSASPATSPTTSPSASPSASPAAPAGKSSDLWLYTGIIVAIIVIVAAVVLVTKRKK